MTWHNRVTTELAQQGLGTRRQRLRRAHDKAWARGDSALGANTTRPGRAHDKDVRATEILNRYILVQ